MYNFVIFIRKAANQSKHFLDVTTTLIIWRRKYYVVHTDKHLLSELILLDRHHNDVHYAYVVNGKVDGLRFIVK